MLQQLLIQVKVNRAKVKRSRKLGGPAYDSFSDVVTELYRWLDSHSIGEIEAHVRVVGKEKPRKAQSPSGAA